MVPKSDNPQPLDDFIPISLVVCIYNITLKLLSLRLKKVLRKVVDFRQSANEVLEEAKRTKKSDVFFKIDYEKAYNSVK